MPEAHSDYDLAFQSAALAPGELFLRRLQGREALSQLFDFELEVESSGGPLDLDVLDDLLAQPAYLAFGSGEEHKIHGVVRRIELLPLSDPAPALYRLRFVPKLFDTGLTSGSWVYQDLSVPEILQDVLKEAGFTEGDDFELRLTGSYPKKEYVVQCQESDLDFLSRQMEHEGIFYYFEHGDERAKLVITDANSTLLPLDGHETIQYDPRAGTTDPAEVVTAFSHVRTMVPKQTKLRDYNYRTPSVSLVAEAEIHELGVGMQMYYGEHFKDLPQGKRLAKVRAQEHLAQRDVFHGKGRVRGLRTGHVFTLEQHVVAAFDAQYLVTEMTHAVSQVQAAPGGVQGYHFDFVAIPAAIAFRPRRLTPRPKLYGVMHAKVDAAQDDQHAVPVDEYGRYKVIMPFDLAGEGGGKASRWVRMIQSASGGGYGLHFPLHAGTEVMLVHLDGDPDRPVIAGSVPNHETVSPVTSANATQSVMRTRNGITVTFDDRS